jgi:Ser/Thr protein kinase RdoA (MazF antagonist)
MPLDSEQTSTEIYSPTEKVDYKGPMAPVVVRLCEEYQLGTPLIFEPIRMGCEDCNMHVQTRFETDGEDPKLKEYVIKMFSSSKTEEEVERYVTTTNKAIEAGVNHPTLYTTTDGEQVYTDQETNISMVAMDFIQGKSYHDKRRPPIREEITDIIQQARIINGMDYKPEYVLDEWAIPNIANMYRKTSPYLSAMDRSLVQKALFEYRKIPVQDLPHCFVHGDLTKTNIIKGVDGKPYIIDFSVSNYYPRIQELAVIATNLLQYEKLHQKEKANISLIEITDHLIKMYNRKNENPLNEKEKAYLYQYSLAGAAMWLMGGYLEKSKRNGNKIEGTRLIQLGHDVLMEEIYKIDHRSART